MCFFYIFSLDIQLFDLYICMKDIIAEQTVTTLDTRFIFKTDKNSRLNHNVNRSLVKELHCLLSKLSL